MSQALTIAIRDLFSRWNWANGVSIPDQAYCDKFYNRTIDLINKYHPDLIYFDDTALPLWPITDAGLKIAAHFYNANNQWHGTNDDGVLFGKILTPEQQQCMVWDIERGQANEIEPLSVADRHLHRRTGITTAAMYDETVTRAPKPSSRCWRISSARTAICC